MEVERLKRTPWCQRILEDPEWTLVTLVGAQREGYDPMWNELLSTPRGVLARCTLRRRSSSPGQTPPIYETRELIQFGPAIKGQDGICHGGFLATAIDEAAGRLIHIYDIGNGLDPFTVNLNMTYKKPVKAPGLILLTSKVVQQERRKIRVLVTLVDADGDECVTTETLFVKKKPKL